MPETIKSFTPVTWKLGVEQVELLLESAKLLGKDDDVALQQIGRSLLTAVQRQEAERRAGVPIGKFLSDGVFFTDTWPDGPPHPSSAFPLLQDAFARLCINLEFVPHPTAGDLLEDGRRWLEKARARSAEDGTDEE